MALTKQAPFTMSQLSVQCNIYNRNNDSNNVHGSTTRVYSVHRINVAQPSGKARNLNWEPPYLFLPCPLSLSLSPIFPFAFPPLPSPSPHLKSKTPKIQLGSLGKRCTLLQSSLCKASTKIKFGALQL